MKTMSRTPDETQCDLVDRLPPSLRKLVHEYGLSIVQTYYNQGVREPQKIRLLVQAARLGAREPGNKRADNHARLALLDDWLILQGAGITAAQIVRVIRDAGYTVLPVSGPTLEMVMASMATVSNGTERCTKEQKHQKRLSAAMHAGDKALWGKP